MASTIKNDKRITNAWCMYDWANSVFPLTITSALFPIYWNAQTKNGVDVLGMHLTDSILFAYCLSFAFVVIALINPLLSGIADSAGNKKSFMKAFVYIGVASCFAMYFFDSQHVYIGIITFILGTIGYAGSIVFYNAYLPEIATEDRYDQLSAKGFSMGYIGGVLLLIINLVMVLKPSLIFGKTWYQSLPGAVKYREDLTYEEILNTKIHPLELQEKYQRLMQKTHDGIIDPDYKKNFPQYSQTANVSSIYELLKLFILKT